MQTMCYGVLFLRALLYSLYTRTRLVYRAQNTAHTTQVIRTIAADSFFSHEFAQALLQSR